MTWTGEEIGAFRKKYKLSKRVLAEYLGITKNYVYLLEAGLRTPSKTLCMLLNRVAMEIQDRKKEVKKDG